MQKILLILVVVFSVATISLGIKNGVALQGARKASADSNATLQDALKKLASFSAQLKEAKEKFSSVGADTQNTAAEISGLRADLEKKTADLQTAESSAKQQNSVIAQQKAELADKDDQITKFQAIHDSSAKTDAASLEDLKKENDELKVLTASQQSKLKDCNAQLAALRERESQRRSKIMRSGLEGKILAVNASWNFVVLSLGDRNGVVSNAEMLIKRGPALIGKVRITSVEPSTSIADIVANSLKPGTTVQPGDSVIYNGPGNDADQIP